VHGRASKGYMENHQSCVSHPSKYTGLRVIEEIKRFFKYSTEKEEYMERKRLCNLIDNVSLDE